MKLFSPQERREQNAGQEGTDGVGDEIKPGVVDGRGEPEAGEIVKKILHDFVAHPERHHKEKGEHKEAKARETKPAIPDRHVADNGGKNPAQTMEYPVAKFASGHDGADKIDEKAEKGHPGYARERPRGKRPDPTPKEIRVEKIRHEIRGAKTEEKKEVILLHAFVLL